jgi:hypothetical protein
MNRILLYNNTFVKWIITCPVIRLLRTLPIRAIIQRHGYVYRRSYCAT